MKDGVATGFGSSAGSGVEWNEAAIAGKFLSESGRPRSRKPRVADATREVAEGDKIPLNGSQIVIRAGDAGAVRVSIAGQGSASSPSSAYPFLVAIHPVPWIIVPFTLPV